MKIVTLATGSSGNSYVLEENGQLVLLELGISLPEIKRGIKYRVADVVTAFSSHVHKDHSMSEKKVSNMGIDVFAPYHDENLMQTHKVNGWYMKSFPLYHGEDVKNCGVYICSPEGHKIVYATDFQRIDYRFKKLGINTFIIECNHDDVVEKEGHEAKWEHSIRDHSSVSVVCEFLRVNKTDALKQVILCHTSEDCLDVKDAVYRVKDVVGENVNLYVAGRGLSVDLE